MNILETIVAHKHKELTIRKAQKSVQDLENSPYFERKTISLKERLQTQEASGIIAEFKRKSPSKNWINQLANASEITQGYEQAGASGLSVLTDEDFFGAQKEDFEIVRNQVSLPMLRKDFMVDEYQIIEAKAMGADVILLIAACLDSNLLLRLAQLAKSLKLEVLLEVHNSTELEENVHEYIDLVGVNNRNLKTFEVSIETSLTLAPMIPSSMVKISESGLSQVDTIKQLRAVGYQGFLMGENFMKTSHPGQSCAEFINNLQA